MPKPDRTTYTISGPFDSAGNPVTPKLGDEVYFLTDPEPVPGAWLELHGYQNDTLCLSGIHAAYDDGTAYGYHKPFQLGPTYVWTEGPANIVVALKFAERGSLMKSRPVAELSFTTL